MNTVQYHRTPADLSPQGYAALQDDALPIFTGPVAAWSNAPPLPQQAPSNFVQPQPTGRSSNSVEVEEAKARIADRFSGAPNAPSPQQLLAMSAEELLQMVSNRSLADKFDAVHQKIDSVKIRSEAAARAQRIQDDEYAEQAKQQQADMQLAKKSGKLGVAFDWIVAVADVVCGVAELATGNIASGLANFAAGIIAMTKTALEEKLQNDPNNEQLRAEIEKLNKAQQSLEYIGVAGNLIGMAVGAGAKMFVKDAAKLLNHEGREGIVELFKNAAREVVAAAERGDLAGAIEKELAKISETLGAKVANGSSTAVEDALKGDFGLGAHFKKPFAAGPLNKVFDPKNIEKLASKQIEELVNKTWKQYGDELVESLKELSAAAKQQNLKGAFNLAELPGGLASVRAQTALIDIVHNFEEIAEKIAKAVSKEVRDALLLSPGNIVKTTAFGVHGAGGKITNGVIDQRRTELRTGSDKNQADIDNLAVFVKGWRKTNQSAYSVAKRLTNEGVDAQQETWTLMSQLASATKLA